MSNPSLWPAIFAALALLSTPAFAEDEQPRCLPLAEMVATLAHQFHETPVLEGISDGALFLLFAAPDGATYTVVKVSPERKACMVDSGTSLQLLTRPEPGEGT